MTQYNELSDKNTETAKITRAILLGCAVGVAVCAVLLSLSAMLFVKLGSLPLGYLPLITTFIGAAGAFTAGYFTVKLYKKRGMLLGALSGVLLFLIVFVTGLVQGIENDVVSALIKCAVFAVMGAIGGVVRVNKKVKVKKYQ